MTRESRLIRQQIAVERELSCKRSIQVRNSSKSAIETRRVGTYLDASAQELWTNEGVDESWISINLPTDTLRVLFFSLAFVEHAVFLFIDC